MTRQEMIKIVAGLQEASVGSLFGYYTDEDDRSLSSEEETDRAEEAYVNQFVKEAQENWLDALIEVYLNPPSWGNKIVWQGDARRLIGKWGSEKPTLVIPRLSLMLSTSSIQTLIVAALGATGRRECLSVLAPLIQRVNLMTEDKARWLVSALHSCHAGKDLLLDLKVAIPLNMVNVHQELSSYL